MSDYTPNPYPLVVTAAGPQPTDPSTLQANLIAAVTAESPGFTANLPGSLIEDITDTDVQSLVIIDQARVETLNDITPYGVNEALLIELGNVYGVAQGTDTNTSVYVVFSGPSGYFISSGFTVSDGTYSYTTQAGVTIGSGDVTLPVYCLAVLSGTWAVPANTVTTITTSLPPGITLTVNNPSSGTPSSGAQSNEDYRSDVIQAGLASAQGMLSYLKTQLRNVPGVQSRLVSVIPQGTGYEVIVGGGDPIAVGNAIFNGLFWLPGLVGSTLNITLISQANPGQVTTALNHNFLTGQQVFITGVNGMTAVNNLYYTITVTGNQTFTIGVNTTGYGVYTSGGVVTPNNRNITVGIYDYPDSYQITFVNPPQQTVVIALLWNTNSVNYVDPTAVSQQGIPAIVSYINSIPVGQPINLFELQNAFQIATANIVPTALLTRMAFSVSINGVATTPTSGTGIIAGDPESYFLTSAPSVSVTQG